MVRLLWSVDVFLGGGLGVGGRVSAGLAAAAFLCADEMKPVDGEELSALRIRAAATEFPVGLAALGLLALKDPVRASRYRALVWLSRVVPFAELRAWPGAGGLPEAWCAGSVVETADFVRREGVPASAVGFLRLLALLDEVGRDVLVEWLSVLPLLAVPDELLHGRVSHATARWALDDGCHRAVMLSLLGVESARVLVGSPAWTD